ncbi:MAG TPA: alkaline phosphatase family protein [Candidatus Cybelea sp.]|jgi:phospholipase C|nr:alkaline phosphatase family protein [Candidatus Cybelea sp.]
MNPRLCMIVVIAGAAIAACAGSGSPSVPTSDMLPATPAKKPASPIQHVVIIVQENRSFDNLFATFPGADGTTTGKVEAVPPSQQSQCPFPRPTTVPLTKSTLVEGDDFGHVYGDFLIDYDKGHVDGFNVDPIPPGGGKIACLYPYVYVDPAQIKQYWNMATKYVLADHLFQTQASSSFTAHQDLIAGGTRIGKLESVIDDPWSFPWGCDSPPGTVTGLITNKLKYNKTGGPFPCYKYKTLRDSLDAKGVTWKFYTPTGSGGKPWLWNAFDAIKAVRNSPEWGKKVVSPETLILSDLQNGALPAVSWVIPDAFNSDHPQECCINGKDVDHGPQWVATVVNAVGRSKYWNSSAVIVLWDDWGGFYDHVPPPFFDNQGGLGFRIPMLIVSPYVLPHIEHTQYETASIVRFIEDNWGLGTLQAPDARATSITNAFHFNQAPRAFTAIPSEYSPAFFLHQQPSGLPVDTE